MGFSCLQLKKDFFVIINSTIIRFIINMRIHRFNGILILSNENSYILMGIHRPMRIHKLKSKSQTQSTNGIPELKIEFPESSNGIPRV